jgi:hypothetical protein
LNAAARRCTLNPNGRSVHLDRLKVCSSVFRVDETEPWINSGRFNHDDAAIRV